MDVAFLASSTRTVTIPPPDPWFAGQPINYYYLGYLVHGTIGRLSGVAPETGFNLALATIFSTTPVAAFGVAWNAIKTLARPAPGSGRRVVRPVRGRHLGQPLRSLAIDPGSDRHRLGVVVGQCRRHRLALQPHRL